MTALRQRAILTPQSRPRLKKHVRLQYDHLRQAWALLAPEKIFWPDETSLSILQLCDGSRFTTQIIVQLAETYEADETDIRPDVEAFLQEWSDRALVSL